MPNKIYSLEWLNLANRNLETARVLLRENHYTDRYPGPRYILPSREEVERYFQFAQQLFKKIKEFLD